MLSVVSKLSRLFSDNTTPYIDYRLVENLFCKYYHAHNDARLCTAYDARIGGLGIGIKTFILGNRHKIEKVAEFNQLRGVLNKYQGKELARKLAEFRNERIDLSIRAYGLTDSIYHIVGRRDGQLELFNYPYEHILIDQIGAVKILNNGSISFSDGRHDYSFDNSKSVLKMKFITPEESVIVPIEILDDPFALLERLIPDMAELATSSSPKWQKGVDYVILPLYSTKGGEKNVPAKSGLNQWNAAGRPRNPNEVYVPIPIEIHKKFPSFFPSRDTPFQLLLPNGRVMSAKLCQENSKALMSNPNQELGRWLLRDILQLEERELVTMDILDKYGIDSVIIRKLPSPNDEPLSYSIDFQSGAYENYEHFIERE